MIPNDHARIVSLHTLNNTAVTVSDFLLFLNPAGANLFQILFTKKLDTVISTQQNSSTVSEQQVLKAQECSSFRYKRMFFLPV